MLGLYDLLERITTRFPHILFESCSGGGGRFDCGMLYYMPQVWTSDNSEELLIKVFQCAKTKIMASGPIIPWETDGETVETVADFIFLGSKITADVIAAMKLKGTLLLGRKILTNLDSILKSRDITLPTAVDLIKAMVFPVVMYGCAAAATKSRQSCPTL